MTTVTTSLCKAVAGVREVMTGATGINPVRIYWSASYAFFAKALSEQQISRIALTYLFCSELV
jgi:hypothetical protein